MLKKLKLILFISIHCITLSAASEASAGAGSSSSLREQLRARLLSARTEHVPLPSLLDPSYYGSHDVKVGIPCAAPLVIEDNEAVNPFLPDGSLRLREVLTYHMSDFETLIWMNPLASESAKTCGRILLKDPYVDSALGKGMVKTTTSSETNGSDGTIINYSTITFRVPDETLPVGYKPFTHIEIAQAHDRCVIRLLPHECKGGLFDNQKQTAELTSHYVEYVVGTIEWLKDTSGKYRETIPFAAFSVKKTRGTENFFEAKYGFLQDTAGKNYVIILLREAPKRYYSLPQNPK